MSTNSPDTGLSAATAFPAATRVSKASPYREFLTLWNKGWLETRLLLFYSLLVFAVNTAAELVRIGNGSANPAPALSDFLLIWVLFPPLLAASGIRTPLRFRASGDAHLSMFYTLSLPVSRFRLLAVRAMVGIVEIVAVDLVVVGAIWMFLPSFRTNAAPQDAILYVLTLFAYTIGFYSLSVLLATLIEGPWRVWGTFLLILGVRWAMMQLPPHFDILAPLASDTPLTTHVLPWTEMCTCISLALLCFVVAWKAVEAREH